MVDFRKELANYNFVEKYSMLKEDETRETWDESVDRIWDMHKVKLAGLNLSEEFRNDIELCRIMEKDKLYLSAQRARQWASTGRGILDKHYRLYNCSGSYADRQEFFKQFIFLLLCGCGAGYNICFRHVQKLPAIKSVTLTHDKYYVEDTIEGWGDVVDYVFNAYMNTGLIGEIDYSKIREKGSLISGRFVHGGYEPLKMAVDDVISTLNSCSGRKLKPIEVFDICCYLSQAVLSGGKNN